jgi:hypothetical protein
MDLCYCVFDSALNSSFFLSYWTSGKIVEASLPHHRPIHSYHLPSQLCAEQESCGSTWQLASLAGAGQLLVVASRKLLAWRLRTCPSRAKEPAEALARSCGLFAAAWDKLTGVREAGVASGKLEEQLVIHISFCLPKKKRPDPVSKSATCTTT